MGRRRRKHGRDALIELGVAIERHGRAQREGAMTAPRWGMTLSVATLLDAFLTEGEKDIGNGKLIVPDTLRPRTVHKTGFSRYEIIAGRPRFEGKILKFIPIGTELTHIDLTDDWTTATLALSDMFDVPIDINWP